MAAEPRFVYRPNHPFGPNIIDRTTGKWWGMDIVREYVDVANAALATQQANRGAESGWWRKRADEIELEVTLGRSNAMRCYTDMRALLQAATKPSAALATQPPTQGAEPTLWVSPEQALNLTDPDDNESGRYLPARRTSAGKFTMALYTAPPPTAEVEKARSDFLIRALTKCESLDRVVDMVHDEDGCPLIDGKARAAIDAALQSDQAQAGKEE